ncbi:hypothetical protein [Embleya sp. AB8]|uniref:hypothetical protein n=1 Tax=Embleya sp. AB8 TaxID=3156304 RepID=UPI003C7615E0
MAIRDQLRGIGGAMGSAAASGRTVVGSRIGAGRASVVSGDWVRVTLDALPAPAVPATAAWEFSLGALVCRHPKVPALTARPLRLLDGLGAVRFGPDTIGFDGEDIPWEKVVRLTVHDAFGAMTTAALDAEVDRIREVLPPLPGRKWAVTKVVEGLLTVVLASLEQADDRRLDSVPVPCEITYRGHLGRQKTLRASLFATALTARQTAVADSLVATARAKGVAVVTAPADSSTAAERTTALRARTDTIAAKLRAQRDQAAELAPAEEENPALDTEATPPGSGPAPAAHLAVPVGATQSTDTTPPSGPTSATPGAPPAGPASRSDVGPPMAPTSPGRTAPTLPRPSGPTHPSDATDPTDPFAC